MNRAEVFSQQRPRLFGIAYRMLGSVMDAEDVVQDTFLRWQQATDGEIASVASPQAYLTTMVTRRCIDQLRSARARREQYVGPWLPEPLLTDPSPDPAEASALADSLSTAFLVLLERLSPLERAVFLLREVFEYSYAEIAQIVGKSEVNCRQLLARARRRIDEQRPRFPASREQHERLVAEFGRAVSEGDMQGLLSVLADDVMLWTDGGGKVAAAVRPIFGVDRVVRGLFGFVSKVPGLVTRMATLNNQPALIAYLDDMPHTAVTFDMAAGRIRAIYAVANPDKLRALPPLRSRRAS